MWKLFKRRRSNAAVLTCAWEKVSLAIQRRQRLYADFLQAKTAGFSRRKLTLLLVAFCLLFGSSSAYVIISAFNMPRRTIKVTAITIPVPANQPKTSNTEPLPLPVKRMLSFQHYMDSLSGTKAGRKVFDSITNSRPGLMDSVKTAIRLFQTSKK
ncbi:hypothetical protein HNQ91_002981 [Filimonas zeae]|uniref:hypothetical protein n=1 Tax=Filimonas zeae TaxID=1737353 RepID=UPI00166837D6|nr:hypothetical protein [Filimonas zeae]MDR6339916.1 hypothetical protein [Filimonas zeae]